MTALLTERATELHRAGSVAEAVDLLATHGGDARVLAGGTVLMLQMRRAEIDPGVLVLIGGLIDLTGIEATDGGLRIGATTTHRLLRTSPTLATAAPAVATAAGLVGGRQTQAVGTIGGNIVNASPAADLVLPLAAHGAIVTVSSVRGDRKLPLLDLAVGPRAPILEPDEMVTAVFVPSPASRTGDAFVKVGRRSAMETSIASVATRVSLDAAGTVDAATIVVGACSPAPLRAEDAEQLLVGTTPGPDAFATAARSVAGIIDPIDDQRASARYRTQLVPGIVAQALDQAVAAAGAAAEEAS